MFPRDRMESHKHAGTMAGTMADKQTSTHMRTYLVVKSEMTNSLYGASVALHQLNTLDLEESAEYARKITKKKRKKTIKRNNKPIRLGDRDERRQEKRQQ